MAGRLEGRVAFVTGAGRGLGRAAAVRLAREGADVIVSDVAGELPGVRYDQPVPEDLDETERLVKAEHRRVVPVVCDVRDLDGMRAAVDAAVADLGRLDVVVANAGICTPAPWDQVGPQQFQDTLDINVTGVWNTIMVGAPHLVRAGGGSIVVVSSAAGLKVAPFMVHYTTSKFAVRGMAKAFAAELAKDGIRVNSVHPTGIRTPMGTGDMGAVLGAAIGGNPRLAGMFTNMLPVETTEPEDVAATIAFLASDEARFITAHELAPDAGVTEM
ncbi:MAG TPA: mycofactocin-coupled SDR family oxidoreductase [Blastococcus sp.]|nr:mycofactocin-coupled SDR family oxidoreductase [Blastococcus sp.]